MHTGRAGLTLIELLVVSIIIATLAGLAIPRMGGFLERAWRQETEHLLWTIHDGEQQYFDKQGKYLELNVFSTTLEWRKVFVDAPERDDADLAHKIPVSFEVEVSGANDDAFLATGSLDGTSKEITIDHNGLLTDNWYL